MTVEATPDPIPLALDLIRRRSITPVDDGALDVLGAKLSALGFGVQRLRFGAVDNLFAKLGAGRPHFCFAGHTDVVPPGEEAHWRFPPFAGVVADGALWGRGAADMKAAIAAMVASVEGYLALHGPPPGAISFLITGDEEGPAQDGTIKALTALAAQGEVFDHCLVGEPTSDAAFADTIKNGRRGSLNAVVRVTGVQGHVAYPQKAANPVPALLDLLAALRARRLDEGAPGFQPSNLEITSVDVGNPAHNVIPAAAHARFNIRFNTAHSGASLLGWIEAERARAAALHPACAIAIEARATGEPFYTDPGPFTDLLCAAAAAHTGRPAQLSTSGGTSDARFIHKACAVAELGLLNTTAHKVDEHAPVAQVQALASLYQDILARYFRTFAEGPAPG